MALFCGAFSSTRQNKAESELERHSNPIPQEGLRPQSNANVLLLPRSSLFFVTLPIAKLPSIWSSRRRTGRCSTDEEYKNCRRHLRETWLCIVTKKIWRLGVRVSVLTCIWLFSVQCRKKAEKKLRRRQDRTLCLWLWSWMMYEYGMVCAEHSRICASCRQNISLRPWINSYSPCKTFGLLRDVLLLYPLASSRRATFRFWWNFIKVLAVARGKPSATFFTMKDVRRLNLRQWEWIHLTVPHYKHTTALYSKHSLSLSSFCRRRRRCPQSAVNWYAHERVELSEFPSMCRVCERRRFCVSRRWNFGMEKIFRCVNCRMSPFSRKMPGRRMLDLIVIVASLYRNKIVFM